MARRQRNPKVIALLEELLEQAQAGDLIHLFAVYGTLERDFTHDYCTDDTGDLIVQVRTEIIIAQCEISKAAALELKQDADPPH